MFLNTQVYIFHMLLKSNSIQIHDAPIIIIIVCRFNLL